MAGAGATGLISYLIASLGSVTSTFLIWFFSNIDRQERSDTSTNQYCKFDSQLLTSFTSLLYLAALVASFFASAVSGMFGRKCSMLFGGVTFLAGAAINGAAINVAMLIIGRILLGVGVGFANQDYNKQIGQLKQEMNYATRGADSIRNDINALAQRYALIDRDEDYGGCHRRILGMGGAQRMSRSYASVGQMAPFYIFPCGHAFHAECLIAHVAQLQAELKQSIFSTCRSNSVYLPETLKLT